MINKILTVGEDWWSYGKGVGEPGHRIFLAGPIERVREGKQRSLLCWRDEALGYLAKSHVPILVFNPEWIARPPGWSYEKQVEWEIKHMRFADVVLFWIQRQPPELPGYTTNIEFGEHLYSEKMVIGSPATAPHIRYMRLRCEMAGITWHHTLEDCCIAAISHGRFKAPWLNSDEGFGL